MCTVVLPLALVLVAVGVVHDAKAVSLVVRPSANELAAIGPLHGSFSVAHATLPLAEVDALLERDRIRSL